MTRRAFRRFARLALLAPFLAAAGCASVPQAPKLAAAALPEDEYDTLPWVMEPPVNIYRRLAMLESAASDLQSSLQHYMKAREMMAQEKSDEQNDKSRFLEEELQREDEAKKKLEDARLREAAQMMRTPEVANTRPIGPIALPDSGLNYLFTHYGFQLGVGLMEQVESARGWMAIAPGGDEEMQMEENDQREESDYNNAASTSYSSSSSASSSSSERR